MSLNIKNEAVHELVRQAAQRTGKSQTSVVEEALRRYLDALDRPARSEAADELLADVHSRIAANPAAYDFGTDDLYDLSGLPA